MSRSLQEWLEHAERVHRVGIDLGLARVGEVAGRMGFAPPAHRPAPRSIIVAGTNGKGSTCIALEALLMAAGFRVGTTLSPHVHVFNERVRIDGNLADDATLCSAFAAVEAARGTIPLTYFEFSALVALHCFRAAAVDVAVLEVGLGGRLDAFNVVAADVAVVTSIGLDHQEFLGDDVETIGREKAGVFRSGQRVVVGTDVSDSVLSAAAALGCRLTRCMVDFQVTERADRWDYSGTAGTFADVPWGPLAPQNCALAIEAAAHFTTLEAGTVRRALAAAALPGRFESHVLTDRQGRPRLMLVDVAHNPAGARFLRRLVETRYPGRRFVGLLGMLADKDAPGVAAAMAGLISRWVCVPTHGGRGQPGPVLAERIGPAVAAGAGIAAAGSVAEGLEQALSLACEGGDGDGILAFGSFSLVEQVRDLLAGGGRAAPDAVAGGGVAIATAMDTGI